MEIFQTFNSSQLSESCQQGSNVIPFETPSVPPALAPLPYTHTRRFVIAVLDHFQLVLETEKVGNICEIT